MVPPFAYLNIYLGVHRAHLDISEDDPHVGETFSVETLRQGDNGMRAIPSSAHGAPTSAEVGSHHITLRGPVLVAKSLPLISVWHGSS